MKRSKRFAPWALCCVTYAISLASCGRSTPLLSNTYPSAHALAAAVINAVAQDDIGALRTLALSEQEFREHVWPELPASRPERNLPFSYVWGDLHQKSEQALARTMGRYGRRRYALVAVGFDGETSRYASYTVHGETVLHVRDERGASHDLRLYGSTIEKDGGWRVFSYIVDD